MYTIKKRQDKRLAHPGVARHRIGTACPFVGRIVVGANTPRPSPQPGTFNSPGGITLDGEGALYVADTRNARIQKLKQ